MDQKELDKLRTEYFRKFPCGISLTKKQQSLADRIRRSLTWLERAMQASTDDLPPRFVDLWIAFNSLYGVTEYKYDPDAKEKTHFQDFLLRLTQSPQGNKRLTTIIEDAQFQELGTYIISNREFNS